MASSQDKFADTTTEESVHHVACNVNQITEPKTMQEALSSEHAKEWNAATDSEFESLIERKT